MKKIIFVIVGAIIGVPISYLMQSEQVQFFTSGFVNYNLNIGELLFNSKTNTIIYVSIGVFAIIGFFIGFKLDKKK